MIFQTGYRISGYDNDSSSVKYSREIVVIAAAAAAAATRSEASDAGSSAAVTRAFLYDGHYASINSVSNATSAVSNQTWTIFDENNCELDFEPPEALTGLESAFLAIILGVLIAIMISGNILVILAITMEKELQRPQYYLVCSLAVADLMVGVVVSPLAALYDINRQWHLGVPMCDFWNLSDVLACTASILHLVAIALDRYWSITDVAYMQKRTASRIGYMILVVWTISCGVSVAPILGWKDSQFHCRVEVKYECLISQDPSYQIFSTTTAFYGPLVLICILYWKIYKAAKKRIQMQVKRRSNINVAHLRAKILASQQQQQQQGEQQTQDAMSSAEGDDCERPMASGCCNKMDNGHLPTNSLPCHHHKKDLIYQNAAAAANVEIRLIQPSSVEATSMVGSGSARNLSSNSAAANSIHQRLGDIEDEGGGEEVLAPTDRPANTPTTDYCKVEASAETAAWFSQKCNGNGMIANIRKVPTEGGSIITGPGGSVDFSTEDEAEYMDGCPPAPPPPPPTTGSHPPGSGDDEEPRRDSLSPGTRRIHHHHHHPIPSGYNCNNKRASTDQRRRSSFKSLSPHLPRYSTVSQSDITSTTCAFACPTPNTNANAAGVGGAVPASKRSRFKTKKESIESSRERRAGRTLAIITGIFVVSWLPFFILAVIRPLCGAHCSIPKPVESVCAWLGYVNSAINPVVYTIFSPDFRNAFKRTLRKFCFFGRPHHSTF